MGRRLTVDVGKIDIMDYNILLLIGHAIKIQQWNVTYICFLAHIFS